jgi:hypothetical protein
MGEILIYLGIAIVAGWLGWHARAVIIIHNISQHPERMIKMLEEIRKINQEEALELAGNTDNPKPSYGAVEVTAEQVGSMYYAYSKDDNQFLGQGRNFTCSGRGISSF